MFGLRRFLRILSVGGLLSVPVHDALAQYGMPGGGGRGGGTRLSLRPQIGFYIPTENLVELSQTGDAGKLEAGPSFGAAIALRFSSHLGIEINGAYVPTTFKVGPAGSLEKQDAKLFLGSGLIVVDVLPASSPLRLFVDGGAGVLSRGGVAFTSQSEKTDVTGVLGAGVGIRLGGLQVIAGTDLYRYKATYEGSGQTTSELTQTDFALKLGLGFGLGGR